jgi:hypothetical protein
MPYKTSQLGLIALGSLSFVQADAEARFPTADTPLNCLSLRPKVTSHPHQIGERIGLHPLHNRLRCAFTVISQMLVLRRPACLTSLGMHDTFVEFSPNNPILAAEAICHLSTFHCLFPGVRCPKTCSDVGSVKQPGRCRNGRWSNCVLYQGRSRG